MAAKKGVPKHKEPESLHSICRWTFNPGKGGFVPADMRPEWGGKFSTVDMINLVGEKIAPRLPENVVLGVEMHYDNEVNEKTAPRIANALRDNDLSLAMITPGAHVHFGYGGIASLDPKERKAAEEFGQRTVDLAYGDLAKAWHPDPEKAPSLVLWNGSFGYDLATPAVREMYNNLKESVANLCTHEMNYVEKLFFAFEPKPNEGHPAMLIPTVASALLFWRKLEEEFGIPRSQKGVNCEFGHSEMIGLDLINDTVEELDDDAMVHMHLNSQGYNDGITLGGPGKYDIDHGVKITGTNIAAARLVQDAGYARWKGHDMQTRPYDDAQQGIDRVVRSIISWEACAKSARELDMPQVLESLAARDTASTEDMMRRAVVKAQQYFDEMYKPAK